MGKRERRMKEPRKLAVVVMLLVMTALTLSVASPAYAHAAHAAEEWATYVCYYFGVC